MNSRERIDELFGTFVATGDPAALGEVFDATSEDLYRLALHLCGAPATAEDLVQATWLAAIEGAETFTAGRPVKPWLTGVLHNQARMHFRREALRSRPVAGAAEPVEDPSLEAERRELADALDRGIGELPEPYGPVVRLHLRHGLNANAIADALGRPAGTVRTQLVRGLDRLRARLPASLAGVAAALALPSRGMAAVRSAVLAQAGPAAATTAAAAAWGSGAKLAALAAALLLVVVGAWRLSVGAAGGPVAPVEPLGLAAAPAGPRADAEVQGAAAPVREVVPERTEPRAGSGDGVARIRGTVVDDGGAAVRGAQVLAFAFTATRTADGFERPAIASAEAGADGSFAIDVPAGSFDLHPVASGWMRIESIGGTLEAGEDCGGFVLKMRPAVRISGRIVDPDGRPVAGEIVELSHSYGLGEHVRTDHPQIIRKGAGQVRVESDEEGRFVVDGPDGAAFWGSVTPERFARWRGKLAFERDAEHLVRLERGARVAGRVFLADGRPAVGAEVWLHGYPPREAVAGTDGGFELVGAVLDAETFLNVAHPEAALFCLQPIPAAHEDLVLQLERPWAIRGRVVDGAGATVVGAVLRVVGARVIDPPADHGVVPTWEWANELDTVRSDTDGEFAFERLYAGPFELQAARDDLGVGRVTQVFAAPASELVVRLTEAAVRRAVVRGTAVAAVSGEPLVGGTVTVLPEGGGMPRRVDVDAEGRFELAGFEPGRYGVTATAAGCADTGVEVELVLGETEVRLEVPPAIDVTLRLVDGSGRPIEAAKVALRRAGGQFVSFRVGQLGLYRLRTDAGGEIALRAVPAEVVDLVVERDGEIDVERRLDLRVEPGARVQVVLAAAEERVEVTVMVAAAGEEVEVDLASREGLMAFRALLGDGRLARPTGVVRATLSVDGGRELAQATATPAGAADEAGPWGPDVPMWRYSVRVESPEGPSGSPASPMPLPSFVLPGRAVRMRLRVEVEGLAPVELVVDGAALAGGASGAPRPPQVVLLRRR